MNPRVIISGGGTGGHIFPAVSIAGEIKRRYPDADILFVGAKGGMEMEVVPRYGYPIKGVWISGIQRQMSLKNLLKNAVFPLKLFVSMMQAGSIYRSFKPQAVIGVGGYASGPMGRVASNKVPLVICEQNAYPGLVNKWLSKRASKILLGNEAAKKYFSGDHVIVTDNPIRSFEKLSREEAAKRLGIDPTLPTILSLGGSLGAGPINEALKAQLDQLTAEGQNIQLVWQAGKRYYETLRSEVPEHPRVKLMPFINDMAAAYGACDLIISRAGGSTISELIALSKPAMLVPAPQLAEDHQTKNARSLSDRNAAILVQQSEAKETLLPEAIALLNDKARLGELQKGIDAIEKHDAAKEIVDQIMDLIGGSGESRNAGGKTQT
jgi:UDP-N-acetylglucosamine--N-acetylmuramyl-(pentapeptide) pyrophosphoryl-undecaprenol N-acetylglucosamine transferase